MSTIADRLNELKGDMTINAMAQRLGLGVSTLYNYLKGRTPGADVIVQVCQAMGVSERWLLTGEGPKWREPVPYSLVAKEKGKKVSDTPRDDVDLTDPEFYRQRILKIVKDLELDELADLYFKVEERRVHRLLERD